MRSVSAHPSGSTRVDDDDGLDTIEWRGVAKSCSDKSRKSLFAVRHAWWWDWGLNRKPPPLCTHQSTTNHSLLRRIYSVSDLLAFRMKVIVLCHAFRPRPSIADPLYFSPPFQATTSLHSLWWSPDKNRKQYCTADGKKESIDGR